MNGTAGEAPRPEKRKGAQLRVLILEDRKTDLEMILHELSRSGFDAVYEHADNEPRYIAKLHPGIDVILADYSLPQFDALRALELLRERDMHIPFIVVTGSISEEAAVACLKSGATDYLLKDRLARLGPAITQALDARKNVEAKLLAEEQIRRRNRELTLLNRIIAASAESSAEEKNYLQVACDELSSAIGVRQTSVILLNDERTEASVVAEYNAGGAYSIHGREFRVGDRSMGDMVAALKAPRVVNNLAADPGYSGMHNALIFGKVASVALIPMLVDSETVGGLALASDEVDHFSDERIELVKSVADQLSNALARSRLERERRRLSAAIEQTTDAVIITDKAHLIQYVNPGFERITGYGRSEVVGKPIRFLEEGGGDEDHPQMSYRSSRDPDEWRGRLVNRRKDGTPYTVDTSLSPIRDKTGAIVNFVGVQRDITEELQLEQRYLQAQKMEAIGRLAGGVAHDFNNLLTAIMGYADILSDRLVPGSAPISDVNEIRRAAERAAGLTRQLLAFSRKQVMQPQNVNLNEIVRDMERMLKPLIGEDIELQTALDPRLGSVRADPGQLEQVIMNLAVNARDAMPSGGRIMIATRNVELDEAYAREHPGIKGGLFVSLTVSDTGTGLSPEALSHLFEPFFTTKEEGKGTGLGLATVYGIVKQSGGHIASASELGKGTSFEILLPRLEKEAERPAWVPEPESERPGSGKVLLVEDNEMVRDLAHKVLSNQGYDVVMARNPDEALEISDGFKGNIDILITDIVMPGMGGKELMEKVKASRPGIKVLLISGYTDTSFILEGRLEPGTAFLQKPFSPRTLIRAVRGVLDG